jgi:outer membrane biosynthesis protein TonB
LRGKNKSLLEDVVIISILGAIIFAIYFFFFSSDEKNETVESPQIIEKQVETAKPEPVINEIKKEEEVQKEKVVQQIENTNKPVVTTPVEQEKTTPKETEKPVIKPIIVQAEKITPKEPENQPTTQIQTQELDEKARVEVFYKIIRDRIYSNIEKNLNKSTIKSGEFVNIRLTVLKDGRYEQLTLIEGNKEYFELIKPSIAQAFPANIEDSLKQSFPRYFRMKVEF